MNRIGHIAEIAESHLGVIKSRKMVMMIKTKYSSLKDGDYDGEEEWAGNCIRDGHFSSSFGRELS